MSVRNCCQHSSYAQLIYVKKLLGVAKLSTAIAAVQMRRVPTAKHTTKQTKLLTAGLAGFSALPVAHTACVWTRPRVR